MKSRCILMFSGGRDSTLAAVRLARLEVPLTLVTVASDHLHGLALVKKRLREMHEHLPDNTPWIRIDDEVDASTLKLSSLTCLPCHRNYMHLGATTARSLGASRLAFGYTAYQAAWPEQSHYGVASAIRVLRKSNISLELPVYDIQSKSSAIAELRDLGLSPTALEQKCAKQVMNIELEPKRLTKAIDEWAQSLQDLLEKERHMKTKPRQTLIGDL